MAGLVYGWEALMVLDGGGLAFEGARGTSVVDEVVGETSWERLSSSTKSSDSP